MEPLTVVVPRLVTKRLLLREFRLGDFEEYAAFSADPLATKHLTGVVDRRQAWRMFSSGAGQWVLQGNGWWMLERLDTKEAVGTVGAFVRSVAPSGDVPSPDIELGWTLYRKAWKQGYALEAATAVRDYALQEWKARRVVAHIARENAPSIAVAERLGMKDEGDIDFFGEPCGKWGVTVPA